MKGRPYAESLDVPYRRHDLLLVVVAAVICAFASLVAMRLFMR